LLPVLAVLAVASFAAALALLLSGTAAPIAAVHLTFALGVLPLIFAAIVHFVPVLTRSRTAEARIERLPVAMAGAGLLVVAAFTLPGFFEPGVLGGALAALVLSAYLLVWIRRRARDALGAPHPGLHWYLAAVACLVLALLAVLVGLHWDAQRNALRVFHLHLNTLGFVGLTAVGTLQVLLPTAVGRPDPGAATRLKRDLPLATAGALLVAVGGGWWPPLAWLGLAACLVPLVRLLAAWAARFGRDALQLHGAASSLALAALGLAVLIATGAGHAAGRLSGLDAVFGFVLAFLLPLVTGALGQLLPLWLKPGPQTAWHAQARERLCRYAGLRAAVFVAAGLFVTCGVRVGAWLGAAALCLFIVPLLRVLRQR